MGTFQFKCEQFLQADVQEVWEFISDPKNLTKITPSDMGFHIRTKELPPKIYPGLIVNYTVKPALNIPTTWVTEITHVKDYVYFVDEQRIGPYRMWHHEHFIEPTERGVLMKDIISYQPPLGILGSLANRLFIKRKLKGIFEYRRKALNALFN